MQLYNINDVLDIDSAEGIWCDFNDHTWFIYVKDETWTDEECQIFNRKMANISYVQKGIVDCFLLTVNDLIEPSDIPFCILDAPGDFFNALKDSQNYKMMILLLDKNNTIKGKKEGTFNSENSIAMKKAFRAQVDTQFDERSYSASLTKLQKKYEPYELEEFSVFTCTI